MEQENKLLSKWFDGLVESLRRDSTFVLMKKKTHIVIPDTSEKQIVCEERSNTSCWKRNVTWAWVHHLQWCEHRCRNGEALEQISGGGTAVTSKKLALWVHRVWSFLVMWPPYQGLWIKPLSVPHSSQGSAVSQFALLSAVPPGWWAGAVPETEQGGKHLVTSSSSSTWLFALVPYALCGNKSIKFHGKSRGYAVFQSKAQRPWDVAMLFK